PPPSWTEDAECASYAKPAKALTRAAFDEVLSFERGDVVQLVRTLPCHGRGRGFESRRPRHSFQKSYSAFGQIGAIHKKIHIKRHPLRPVSFFLPAESFPPLCSALAASCC